MKKKLTCFLPCRSGSERIPKKNTRPFANFNFGLVELKVSQLLSCDSIDEIIVSTDDKEIINYVERLNNAKLIVHCRAACLSSSETSTDQLVAHALSLIPEGDILWTHVTSPFINESIYEKIINSYKINLSQGYDSLMTVNELYGFLWKNGQPFNYDKTREKWPRTQTLEPIFEINNGAFLASAHVYKEQNDRIGVNPYFFKLDKIEGHDIDWPEDFLIAECMAEKRIAGF
jgi:CMP-N-acetylneuraminic acid synthetase